MPRAGKGRFSLDSLWLYGLAVGAVGVTGWMIWRSPLLSTPATNSDHVAAAPAAPAAQSDLERLMAMSTAQAAARPADTAGANDARRGELVIVGKSGVTRVMTKPPAEDPSAAARSSALAASGTPGAPTKPGPRVYEPDPLPPRISDGSDGKPQYYDYDKAEAQRANSGGLPTYYDQRDNRPR